MGVFEVMGIGERRGMGPRMLAALLDALAELARDFPAVVPTAATRLASVFTHQAELEETDARAARAEWLEELRARHDAHVATAKKAAAC